MRRPWIQGGLQAQRTRVRDHDMFFGDRRSLYDHVRIRAESAHMRHIDRSRLALWGFTLIEINVCTHFAHSVLAHREEQCSGDRGLGQGVDGAILAKGHAIEGIAWVELASSSN